MGWHNPSAVFCMGPLNCEEQSILLIPFIAVVIFSSQFPYIEYNKLHNRLMVILQYKLWLIFTMTYDFQGKPCSTAGVTRCSMRLGRIDYDSAFTVINAQYGPDCILGTPFMSRYGLTDLMRERISDMTGKNCFLNGEPHLPRKN